jgi:hypothetical protein
MPLIREACIGDGFEKIQRIQSPWNIKDECDLFVFPDIGFAGMQKELISQGFPVWGARYGDRLEVFRGHFLDTLKKTGLNVPKYEEIKGLTNLQLFLKDKEDKWIKISLFRGDWETMHFASWRQDEGTLDGYAVRFGPLKEQITFYVFDPIETEIEDGCDTWCIDGQWPKTIVHGMEAKDKAFVGVIQPFEDLPDAVKEVNKAFGPILSDFGYRSFFSSEVRITEDGDSFFIDPTCRAGSPPSQVQCEMFSNYSDIIWRGAQGELVEPEPEAKFGVQVALKTTNDRSEWLAIDLPEELRRWVKCGFCCEVKGRLCFPPVTEYNTNELGYLCSIGDTMEEAIESLRQKQEILPDGVKCEFMAMLDLIKELESAKEQGIKFGSDPIPDPNVVLA